MLIASASNNQTIAPTSSVKLRRSRRLSSTRGLKQRTTTNIPKDSFPCQDLSQILDLCPAPSKSDEGNIKDRLLINWEMNERISLSSGSSVGLAIRPDSRKGIEFSENRRREIETRSKIGERENSERNCEAKSSSLSSIKPTLQLMNVSGFLSNVDRKHHGNSHSIEINTTDENILKSDSKYEIGIPSRSSVTRKQRQQNTLRKDNVEATRESTKNKSGDSISKRLELIHELNQKILANYERFQQRSKRAKDAKEQTIKNRVKERIHPEEHIYTEIKRKNKTTYRTSDRKNQGILKQDISNQETLKKDFAKRDTCRQANTDKSILSKSYYESIKDRTEKKDILKATNKPDCRIVCENTNFSMAAKENFFYQINEKTQPSKYVKLRNKKGRWPEEGSVFYANEDVPPKEIESIETQDCLENSRVYPESCNLYNNEPEQVSLKKDAKDVSKIDRSDPRGDAESRAGSEDTVTDEKILENKILESLDETIDKFDSEKTQLTSEDSNEEKDSFSTDSIQSGSPSSVKDSKDAVNLLDTFNSSWDSGVGVDVGNGSGWVRIHTGIESSLVYLTLDTTAKDVCRDMLLGDDLSLFVQVNASLRR